MPEERIAQRNSSRHYQDFEAISWLAERGFAVVQHDKPFHLTADEQDHAGFALRRIRISSCTIALQQGAVNDAFCAILVIDGILVTSEEEFPDITYPPRSMLFRKLDHRTIVEIRRPSTLIQVTSESARIIPSGRIPKATTAPIFPIRSVLDPFVAYAIAALNFPLPPYHPAFRTHRRAVEAMVSAIVMADDLLVERNPRTSTQQQLLNRAQAVISTRMDDPSLTLTSIAKELSVSNVHLIRAFSGTGTTPMRYLRELRAAEAIAVLYGLGDLPKDQARELAARRAGFPTTRAMMDAIRREYGSAPTT